LHKIIPPVQASQLKSIFNLSDKSYQTIEDQRMNPNSPLYAVKSFEELSLKPHILKGIYAMGFSAPSKIQVTYHYHISERTCNQKSV
jgi:ATP-dependent RNA helicase DDX19/DBP5